MNENNKKLIQDIIDRLLYNSDFKEKLEKLLIENPLNKTMNYKTTDFKYNENNRRNS